MQIRIFVYSKFQSIDTKRMFVMLDFYESHVLEDRNIALPERKFYYSNPVINLKAFEKTRIAFGD